MAWVNPRTSVTGEMHTAAMLNETRDNLNALRARSFDVFLGIDVGNPTWNNLPAGPVEAETTDRAAVNLTEFTEVRLWGVMSGSVGAAGTVVRLQASPDLAAWTYIDGGTGDPPLDISVAGVRRSVWASVHASFRTDVYLRAVATGGNSVADPIASSLHAQFR